MVHIESIADGKQMIRTTEALLVAFLPFGRPSFEVALGIESSERFLHSVWSWTRLKRYLQTGKIIEQ